MKDEWGAILIAVSVTTLAVLLPASIVEDHLPGSFPLVERFRSAGARSSKRTLPFELAFLLPLLGGGEFVMALVLVHPASSPLVRLIAASQLVLALVWAGHALHAVRSRSGRAMNRRGRPR